MEKMIETAGFGDILQKIEAAERLSATDAIRLFESPDLPVIEYRYQFITLFYTDSVLVKYMSAVFPYNRQSGNALKPLERCTAFFCLDSIKPSSFSSCTSPIAAAISVILRLKPSIS